MILNLTQHNTTPVQAAQGVIDPRYKYKLKKLFSSIPVGDYNDTTATIIDKIVKIVKGVSFSIYSHDTKKQIDAVLLPPIPNECFENVLEQNLIEEGYTPMFELYESCNYFVEADMPYDDDPEYITHNVQITNKYYNVRRDISGIFHISFEHVVNICSKYNRYCDYEYGTCEGYEEGICGMTCTHQGKKYHCKYADCTVLTHEQALVKRPEWCAKVVETLKEC